MVIFRSVPGILGSAKTSLSGPSIEVAATAGVADSNPPQFYFVLPAGTQTGDTIRIQFALQSDVSWSNPIVYTHTLASGDLVYPYNVSFGGVSSLSAGSWKARARSERGAAESTWSDVSNFVASGVNLTPSNYAAPVVTGTTTVGSILSTTNGSWTEYPTGYTYQWRRNGSNIGSATSPTYTLVFADNGQSITCLVTASNANGVGTAATSNAVSVLAVPSNTVAPLVSGTATAGYILSTTDGTWANNPTGYAYQWTRDGSSIAGATSNTYTLVSADSGKSVACVITASNASGTGTPATSNTVSVSASVQPPANSVAPVISGNVQVGQTLSTTNGSWSNDPTGYTYQWKRGASSIASATASTYMLAEADAGQSITCAVTATNAAGSTAQASNALVIDVYKVFVDHGEDPSDLTTYNFGTKNFGVYAPNRMLVIAASWRGGATTVSSSSIGGGAGNAPISEDYYTTNQAISIFTATPAGASGTISLTLNGPSARCGVIVWAVYGAASATPYDTKHNKYAGSSSLSAGSLSVPAGGVGIAACSANNSGAGTTVHAWSSPMVADYTATIETSVNQSGASMASHSGASVTIMDTYTPNVTASAIASASWGHA